MKLMYTILAALIVPTLGVLASPISDPELEKARKFVESSDRYLHHSHLKRGMKGYGLTVFAGTKIERFEARIVSVVKNFNPGQDVILAMLDEEKLKNSQVIAGMSGSPVFMKDPADGKFKMIGAVAYGRRGEHPRHAGGHEGREGPPIAPRSGPEQAAAKPLKRPGPKKIARKRKKGKAAESGKDATNPGPLRITTFPRPWMSMNI